MYKTNRMCLEANQHGVLWNVVHGGGCPYIYIYTYVNIMYKYIYINIYIYTLNLGHISRNLPGRFLVLRLIRHIKEPPGEVPHEEPPGEVPSGLLVLELPCSSGFLLLNCCTICLWSGSLSTFLKLYMDEFLRGYCVQLSMLDHLLRT